jgi:hypothetical protein
LNQVPYKTRVQLNPNVSEGGAHAIIALSQDGELRGSQNDVGISLTAFFFSSPGDS